MLKASQVLALANSNETSSQRSIKVTRPLDQENDLGNLLGSEINEFTLNPNELETDLKSLARDNCQLIINDIFNLPTERVEEVIVATLPPPTESVPREKTIPKAKPLTKWEQYAKEKGIQKENHLPQMLWVKSKKWIKIKGDASPYNGDNVYWAKRTMNLSRPEGTRSVLVFPSETLGTKELTT